jgi:hypothetical protein
MRRSVLLLAIVGRLDSFGRVVGAGLIGGAAGYITGSAIGNK